jgi:hypothetical protein
MENYDSNLQIIEHPIISSLTDEVPVLRAVCNYWRETIRQSREARLSDFLESIAEKLASLEIKTNLIAEKVHIGSSDYFNTIEQLAEYAVKTNDKDKIEYLKKFAIQYALDQRPDIQLKDIYIGIVNQLTGMHFIILEVLYARQKNLSNFDLMSLVDMPERSESINLENIAELIKMNEELIITIIYSLRNVGLLKINNVQISNPYIIIEPLGLKLMRFLNNYE